MRYALAYSGLVVVGAVLTRGESLRHFGRPLVVIVAFHLAGALFVGFLAGVVWQWATSPFKGWLLGTLIGIPVAFSTCVVFRPQFSLRVMVISTAISAVVLGGGVGLIVAWPIDRAR
jgi:hypothetical protein